jgi:hypothetical protein
MVNRNVLVTAGNTTIVKKVVLGRPVRRVQEQRLDFQEINGIDFTGKTNGSVLVYNSSSELWEATLDLEEQNINGGSY